VTGDHREIDVYGTVEQLVNAKKVTIVPGYGLAVAKAQYGIAELVTILHKHGVKVRGEGASGGVQMIPPPPPAYG